VLDHEHLLRVVLYCYTNTRPKIHNNNMLDHEHLLEVVLYCYTNTRPKIHNNKHIIIMYFWPCIGITV
jgi:hypothetical protein